jgi:TonB family protein
MMSAIANSLPKPQGFDLYLRKFRVICTMHGVEVGSRTNLPAFMQKLMEDRHLAMDFWALIGKLSAREGGELSDDQILAVVVESVTGGELSDEDAETKRIVGDLRAMLSGVDIHGPGEGQVELAPFPQNEAAQLQDDREWRTHAAESSPKPSESPRASTSGTVDGEATRPSALPSMPPLKLDEEFLRRELTRLVQLYFDSLDKKRSRLEPYLDDLISIANVAGATTPRSLEELDGADELTFRPIGKSRLVLAPAASSAEASFATKEASIPMRVPLEDYPQPPRYRRAIVYLLITLGLFEACFASYRHRAPLQREVGLLIQDIRVKTGMAPSPNLSGPPAASLDPAASVEKKSSTSQAKQDQQSAKQMAFQGNSTPPLPAAGVGITPTHAASIGSQTAEGGVDSNNNRKTMADRVAVQAEQIAANVITNADLAGAVRVSPSAMEANLVASRVPAYPETAKIEGVEGSVVMQAIISKDGFVKRMHVIQGDSRLRSAATEAVAKWRYRPYMLSGQPVEVATTITVDFDLDRR